MLKLSEKSIFYGCLFCLIFILFISNFFVLPVIVQMFLYTFPIIYTGSHLSLKQNEVDPVTGEMRNTSESMNHKEAMLFPVFGSIALCTLYVAYKFFDPYYVNVLLTTYLMTIGIFATAETLELFTSPIWVWVFKNEKSFSGSFKFWPLGSKTEPCDYKLTVHTILSYISATCLGLSWMIFKSWVIHNFFAISFCIQAISFVSVGSFKVASVLLVGLFVYDIFWVFGTEVMVTVALAFEGPAKLIFPVSLNPWAQSILGLGDIVIPGIFISMCLRFDNFMHNMMAQKLKKKNDDSEVIDLKDNSCIDIHQNFGKFYFWVVMIFYELGLVTTGLVMFIFKHAQPALLYLVPFCLFSLFAAATFNGEVKDVLAYKEDNTPPSEEVKKEKGKTTEIKNETKEFTENNMTETVKQ